MQRRYLQELEFTKPLVLDIHYTQILVIYFLPYLVLNTDILQLDFDNGFERISILAWLVAIYI